MCCVKAAPEQFARNVEVDGGHYPESTRAMALEFLLILLQRGPETVASALASLTFDSQEAIAAWVGDSTAMVCPHPSLCTTTNGRNSDLTTTPPLRGTKVTDTVR